LIRFLQRFMEQKKPDPHQTFFALVNLALLPLNDPKLIGLYNRFHYII
jgi:hypothetical protein